MSDYLHAAAGMPSPLLLECLTHRVINIEITAESLARKASEEKRVKFVAKELFEAASVWGIRRLGWARAQTADLQKSESAAWLHAVDLPLRVRLRAKEVAKAEPIPGGSAARAQPPLLDGELVGAYLRLIDEAYGTAYPHIFLPMIRNAFAQLVEERAKRTDPELASSSSEERVSVRQKSGRHQMEVARLIPTHTPAYVKQRCQALVDAFWKLQAEQQPEARAVLDEAKSLADRISPRDWKEPHESIAAAYTYIGQSAKAEEVMQCMREHRSNLSDSYDRAHLLGSTRSARR